MKKILRVYLLVVFTLSLVSGVFAQVEKTKAADAQLLREVQKERELYIADIVEITETLPVLMAEDPDRAKAIIASYSSLLDVQLTLSEKVKPFTKSEVDYLKGHLVAYEQKDQDLYSYYSKLLKDSGILKDQPVMVYLQYLLRMGKGTASDQKAASELLMAVMNTKSSGSMSPAYYLIWSDRVAAQGDTASVNQLLAAYDKTRKAVQTTVIPRKTAIYQRLLQLQDDEFYINPTPEKANTLKNKLYGIDNELAVLYNDLFDMEGVVYKENINIMRRTEQRIIGDLIANVDSYLTEYNANMDQIKLRKEVIKPRITALLEKNTKRVNEYVAMVDTLDIWQKYGKSGQDYTVYTDAELLRLFYAAAQAYRYQQYSATSDTILINQKGLYPDEVTNLQDMKQAYEAAALKAWAQYETYLGMIAPENRDIYELAVSEYLSNLRANLGIEREDIINDYEIVILERKKFDVNKLDVPPDQSLTLLTVDQARLDAQYEYLKLQSDFRSIRNLEVAFAKLPGTTDSVTRAVKKAEIDARKRQYLQRANAFVQANPNFKGFEQPTGGFLVSNADLFYNMGEMQYDLDANDKTQALAYYNKVLDIDPQHDYRENVLYNRGFITMVMAKDQINSNRSTGLNGQTGAKFTVDALKVPIASFEEIRDSYPASPIRDEAIYHLGNMYFLIAADNKEMAREYYAKASDCFNTIIAQKDSPYYYHALYQRGYVGLNQADNDAYTRSIKNNVEILTAIEAGKFAGTIYDKPYKEAAIDNIAFALIALDGEDFFKDAEGAKENQLFDGITDEETIAMIYDKAAMRKTTDLNAPKQAIDLMLARVRKFPNAITNPTIIDSTVVLYNQYYNELSKADQAGKTNPLDYRYAQYVRIKDSYNQNSEWYKKNLDKPQMEAQLKVIDKAYELIEIRLRNNFVTNPSMENLAAYQNHIDQYKQFTALHGANLQARELAWGKNVTNFGAILAERSTNPQDWVKAVSMLYAYNDDPAHTADFNYEGLAFKYTQTLYNDQMPKFKAGNYKAPDGVPADTISLYDYYVAGAMRFVNKLELPENKTAANDKLAEEILLSLGDISFESGRFDKALEHYSAQLVRANELTDPKAKAAAQRNLYLKMAQCYEAQKNYNQAEANYRLALGVANDAQDRELIMNNIALQIQNSVDAARESGNKALMGDEYVRFAAEYKVSNPARYLGYMQEAKTAYLEANQAQKAIDILVQLASERDKSDEVYALSYQAWDIAETKLNDGLQAKRLKDAFIARYPLTVEAYALRVEAIDMMAKDASTREAAADAYMALYGEAVAKTINIGEDKPEDLYLTAVDLYRQNGNQEKLMNSLIRFIELYPNHPNVIPYMIYLADEYQKQGNEAEYLRYSRAMFLKDKTQFARYQNIANAHLGKIAYEFDLARVRATKNTEFVKADWDQVYAKRDEFKAAEAKYIKEGLTFNSQTMYDNIAAAENDRKQIEARIAFLKNYDAQLNTIERSGFLVTSPAALITVNQNTTWKNHLFGGKANRVPALRPVVTAEVKKVIRLIENGAQYNLDNARRTRALNLISRINEHAADAIKAQVDQYINVSYELAPYKNRNTMSQEEYDQLIEGLKNHAAQFSQEYLNDSYAAHLQIFNTYYMAGYRDKNTAYTLGKLEEWKVVPDYQKSEYILGTGWNLQLEKPAPGAANLLSQATTETSPNGVSLGKLSIPAGNGLILTKTITSKVQPEFGFVQMVYPFDAEIKVNDILVEPAYVPTDTLVTGDPNTIRYAVMIGAEYWSEGTNNITLKFPNHASELLPLYMNLQVYLDNEKLANAVSTETVKYVTDNSWKVITNDTAKPAVVADKFNIPMEKVVGMEKTTAKPIWVSETVDNRINNVVFEYTFDMNTAFKEGYISFVAPMEAAIELNGAQIATGEALDYDADPLVVYPIRINFDAQNIVNGKNTLRLIVTNPSDYRGMLAEISITQTVKE